MNEHMTEERLKEIEDKTLARGDSAESYHVFMDTAYDTLPELAAEVRRCWLEIDRLKTPDAKRPFDPRKYSPTIKED